MVVRVGIFVEISQIVSSKQNASGFLVLIDNKKDH